MKTITAKALREIEKELSLPLFFQVPIGSTLFTTLRMFYYGLWTENWKIPWLYRLLRLRYWFFPKRNKTPQKLFSKGKILFSLSDATPRLTELVLPILKEFNSEHCVVLCKNDSIIPFIPKNVHSIVWDKVQSYKVKDWRNEYRRCNPEWTVKLKLICHQYELLKGAYEVIKFSLMIYSQQVAGCIAFLEITRPAVIVTDYDRDSNWSCLVLAARLLGVPTVTLVHGNMGEDSIGFSPVLSDKIVSWGVLDREKLIKAGESSDKIIIGGCPRMSRNIFSHRENSRNKLSLDLMKPVVMFVATNEKHNLEFVKLFCHAIEMLGYVSGIVRLHPVEKLASYSAIIDQHHLVKFVENHQVSLDESIASADVVVFHNSGMGSDVLVKRRPLVLLEIDEEPSGLGRDVVTLAGCPHVRTSDELADVLCKILLDNSVREKLVLAAEPYVKSFCYAYGDEAARLTANIIRQLVNDNN